MVLDVAWGECGMDTSLQNLMPERLICEEHKAVRHPSSTLVQPTFNHGKNVLLILSAGTFWWTCGRKHASFLQIIVNWHETSFIRNSLAWEPPLIFWNSTCCVTIAETINEVHINILLICVQCIWYCLQYTRFNYVLQLRTLILDVEKATKCMCYQNGTHEEQLL